jgi:chromosome segregation ATPase
MLDELRDAREEIERLRGEIESWKALVRDYEGKIERLQVALREAKGVMAWIQESSGRDLGEEIAAIEAVLQVPE